MKKVLKYSYLKAEWLARLLACVLLWLYAANGSRAEFFKRLAPAGRSGKNDRRFAELSHEHTSKGAPKRSGDSKPCVMPSISVRRATMI